MEHGVQVDPREDLEQHLRSLIMALRRRHRDAYEDTSGTMTEKEIDQLTRVGGGAVVCWKHRCF